ncbi:MAG: S8 family serine peptidase, partial [Eubacterium sp.]|nr:S8 family serine peptidase [Eubacterium sp.]
AGGSNVIALIDSGVPEHGNVQERISVIGDDPGDDNGHGSRMLTAITAQNPSASVLSVKALDAAGYGTVSSLYAAITYAMEKGVRIISLSVSAYSGEENAILEDLILSAAEQGIAVIGAAGNQGQDASYFIPGKIGRAVIVGACDENGSILSNSNHGGTVDYYVNAPTTSLAAATLAGNMSRDGTVHVGNKLIFDGTNAGNWYQESEVPVVRDYRFRAQGTEPGEAAGTVTITPGESVYYDGWETCLFNVAAPDGNNYIGYCLQPNSPTPSGSFTAYEYEGSGDQAAAYFMNLMLVSPYSPYDAAKAHFNNMFAHAAGAGDLTKYAFIHAAMSYMYCGSVTGLSQSGYNAVVEAKNLSVNTLGGSYASANFPDMHCYIVPNGGQDIMFMSYDLNPGVEVTMEKAWTDTKTTEGSSHFDLDGTTIRWYRSEQDAKADKNAAAIFIFDKNGKVKEAYDGSGTKSENGCVTLEEGEYWYAETVAPKGADPKIPPADGKPVKVSVR